MCIYKLSDLKNKLLDTEKINSKYFYKNINTYKYLDKKDFYKDDKEDFAPFSNKELQNELWLPYPNIDDLYVSSLGRLIYKKIFVEQVEKYENIKLKKEKDDRVGYLQIEREKYSYLWNKIKEEFIYQIVARIWLNDGKEIPNQIAVHHISNDGYDNSVNNLILMKKCQHDFLHFGITDKSCNMQNCINCTVNKNISKYGMEIKDIK